MAGANLSYQRSGRLWKQIKKLLGRKAIGHHLKAVTNNLCTKAGIPADNTAADAPNAAGDICLDTTNNKVYISKSYTNATSHDWVLIT